MNTICTVQLQFAKSKMLSETFLSFKYVFIVSVTIQTNFGVYVHFIYNLSLYSVYFKNIPIIH